MPQPLPPLDIPRWLADDPRHLAWRVAMAFALDRPRLLMPRARPKRPAGTSAPADAQPRADAQPPAMPDRP